MSIRTHLLLCPAPAALLLFLLSACGDTDSSAAGVGVSAGDFQVKQTFPETNGTAFLNQSILVEFTGEVDLGSVDLNAWSFEAYDGSSGQTTGETVIGTFGYHETVTGLIDRRTIEFRPAFPSNATYDNGGFRAGRRYEVRINGGTGSQTPVVRSITHAPLVKGYTFVFSTPTGTTPEELFYDEEVGGPARTGFFPDETNPTVGLNYFIAPGFSRGGGDRDPVTLVFNQPLNPAPYNFNQDHIFLQYSDPGLNPAAKTRIEAELELAENVKDHATVTLTPVGVLPSNAAIEVIVEPELQDLAGESNQNNLGYNRVFARLHTDPATAFQYDAIVQEFTDRELIDEDAAFREPMADVKEGVLKASFGYDGGFTIYDFEPLQKEVILNTDFTQVVPKQGVPFTVTGGLFNFRNVTIPEGVRVVGQGSNPLVFLVSGDVEIRGEITVNGGAGARVDTLNSANFATPGGAGHCGGGAGGQASPIVTASSPKGEDGYGAFQKISPQGGRGGHTGSTTGAGGGGGSFSTKGDPEYGISYSGLVTGRGGNGTGTDAITRKSPAQGGEAGATVWQDQDPDNNFYGRTTEVVGGQEVAIQGELKGLTGGAGGGGGGDRVTGTFPSGFPSNQKGGGGGGGAGIIVIRALGQIRVFATGRISAIGGDGGGGEPAGGNQYGGGGAGGSGGMIVLESATKVIVDNRSGSYNFGVTADGGVNVTGTFGTGTGIQKKRYPPNSSGSPNRGGYGGLGLIQLMAPDPENNVTFTQGQVKPTPVLLPSSFGFLSRVRSRWIDTGATARQTTKPGEPRYLDNSSEPGKYGPEYRFSGTQVTGIGAGYIDFRTSNAIPGKPVGWVNWQEALSGLKRITGLVPVGAGSSFHLLECAGGLGGENTLRGMRLQVVEGDVASAVIEEFLVVGNTDTRVYLKPEVGKDFNAALAGTAARPNSFKVLKKYFSVETNNNEGLPMDGNAEVLANVRIGFAACSGFAPDGKPLDRWPASGFAFDLETAAGREAFWRQGTGIKSRPHLMFDVLFNISYNKNSPNQPRGSLSPDDPLPELNYLVVPFRF